MQVSHESAFLHVAQPAAFEHNLQSPLNKYLPSSQDEHKFCLSQVLQLFFGLQEIH
jgi:hypothetical protein